MAVHQTNPPWALLGRLTWMLFGPLLLVLLTFSILSSGAGWLTLVDVAYFTILGAMLLGRWLEFQGGHPQTTSGEPATEEQLHRYLFLAAAVGLAVWVAANYVGNHWTR